MQTIQLKIPESLIHKIDKIENVLLELENFKKNFKPKEPTTYLTRNEVASMFKINLSSVHNWCKNGTLQAYQISGRVIFKLEEVESAIVKLQK